jgi:hypothetical protein
MADYKDVQVPRLKTYERPGDFKTTDPILHWL